MRLFHRKSREQRVIDDIFKRLDHDLNGRRLPLSEGAGWRVVNAQTDLSVAGPFGSPEVRLMVELVRTR